MGLNLLDTRIILVRPRNPLNIAAAARAMSNFGLADLVVVAAYEPVWQDARAAPGAKDLLRHARVVPRLLDAIEDRTLVVGTSSLARRRPLQAVVSLDRLQSLSRRRKAPERLAILFGSEKTGLSNQDLRHCNFVLRIPTEERAPAMNLGQAVAVCCYELLRAVQPRRGRPQQYSEPREPGGPAEPTAESVAGAPATVGEVDRLVAAVEALLGENSEGVPSPARARSAQLREMLWRCPLRSRDVSLLLGVLRDIRNRERGRGNR